MSLNSDVASLEKDKEVHPLISGDEKILLIGAAGQIGEHIKPILEKLYPGHVIATARKGNVDKNITALDITDTDGMLKLVEEQNVKVVINMAAFLSSRAEGEPDMAREVNLHAVKRLIEGCEKLGVRQVFTPSTIAVYGKGTEYDASQEGRYATMETVPKPTGVYATSKVDLENFMRDWNAAGHQTFTTGMRLGGVLACKLPPSEGTAMEFDKMIIAAAHKKKTEGAYGPLKEHYIDDKGVYHPQIPATAKLPFIHVDDAAREIVRYVHNVKRDDPNATRHHLASFVMDMDFLSKQLSNLTNNHFQYQFGNPIQKTRRAEFIGMWPTEVDMSDGKAWGFDPVACKNQRKAIYKCFEAVTQSLEQDNSRGAAR